MVYLYLAMFFIASFSKTYSGKRTSQIVKRDSDTFLVYSLRMFFCLVIGFFLLVFAGNLSTAKITGTANLLCLFSGAVNSIFLLVWFYSVRVCSMMTISISLLLGAAIPIAVDYIFLKSSTFSIFKIIGIVLIFVAMLLLSGYEKSRSGKMGIKQILFLFGNFVLEGSIELGSLLLNVYNEKNAAAPCSTSVYSFYTYLYGTSILLIAFFVIKLLEQKKVRDNQKAEMTPEVRAQIPEAYRAPDRIGALVKRLSPVGIHLIIMSTFTFIHLFFQTRALEPGLLDRDVVLSTMKAGNLLVSFALGLIFKEKPTAKSILGVIVAMIALFCINLLPKVFGF